MLPPNPGGFPQKGENQEMLGAPFPPPQTLTMQLTPLTDGRSADNTNKIKPRCHFPYPKAQPTFPAGLEASGALCEEQPWHGVELSRFPCSEATAEFICTRLSLPELNHSWVTSSDPVPCILCSMESQLLPSSLPALCVGGNFLDYQRESSVPALLLLPTLNPRCSGLLPTFIPLLSSGSRHGNPGRGALAGW